MLFLMLLVCREFDVYVCVIALCTFPKLLVSAVSFADGALLGCPRFGIIVN